MIGAIRKLEKHCRESDDSRCGQCQVVDQQVRWLGNLLLNQSIELGMAFARHLAAGRSS